MSRAPPRTTSSADIHAITAASQAARRSAAAGQTRPSTFKRASSSYMSGNSSISSNFSSEQYARDPGGPIGLPLAANTDNGPQNMRWNGVDSGPSRNTVQVAPLLQPPADIQRNDSKSPSRHAALFAAARAPPSAMMGIALADNVRRAHTVKRPSAPPKPRRLSAQFDSSASLVREKPTDATPIPPTTTLVELFEEKVMMPQRSGRRPALEPVVIAPSPDLPLASPKPLRSSGRVTTMFEMEVNKLKDQPRSITPKSNLVKRERTSWDPNSRTFRPLSEILSFEREMSAAIKRDRRRSVDGQDTDAVVNQPKQNRSDQKSLHALAGYGGIPSPKRLSVDNAKPSLVHRHSLQSLDGNIGSTATKRFSVDSANSVATDQVDTGLIMLKHASTDPIKLRSVSVQSGNTAISLAGQYHQLYPRRQTPAMTGDQLADAMVASSLASSRTASPYKHSKYDTIAPPAPRHRHNLFLSRTPSPAKAGMRHTLRKVESDSSESEDELHPYSKHRGHKHRLVRKHPHKHHEGDRKRWREAVTERERKRYEGVWAANKGMYVVLTPAEQSVLDQSSPDSATARDFQKAAQEQVSNIVVRELWNRSRLPATTLEMVWDLVDNEGVGRLSKQEFVVGLWLIDQRLKGRKLPVKVSESMWASVRGTAGIRVRTSIK